MKGCKKLLTDKLAFFLLIGLVISFFYPFIFWGKIPMPADTIVGMYYPFKDEIWNGFTGGVPFKNFLITDPVRQTYVWRKLAVDSFKKRELPLWNPYSFAGTPLLANFQSAVFYPLNILFFLFSFPLAWGILVVLQPLLSSVFMYLFLKNKNLDSRACFLGSFCFSFSAFMIVWLEWNTIGHVVLWLPLILLSVDKMLCCLNLTKRLFFWNFLFIFGLASSFFAGHLQIFFYLSLIVVSYILAKIVLARAERIRAILLFAFCFLLFALISSVQWLATLRFVLLSARGADQAAFLKEGWFIPWQNLIQFIAPDFFGNPATLNYWGVWNYAEMVGYIGIIPLILALFALFFRKDKKTMFFGTVFFLSLIFATSTFLARLPYQFKIPFISTSQPTRLLFLTDFSLAVLASFGFDYFLKNANTKSTTIRIVGLLGVVGIVYVIFWFFILFFANFDSSVSLENISIARRNLILPSALFVVSFLLFLLLLLLKQKRLSVGLTYIVVMVVVFDLFRFGWKFLPFSEREWIFPTTKLINLVAKDGNKGRFMSVDRRIMRANFSAFYKMQDVSGYDPLYMNSYGRLVSSWNKGETDLTLSSFNRIVTPQNYENFITDFLGVEYIMSFGPLESGKLQLISSRGETYLYKNRKAFPRAFLVEKVMQVDSLEKELDSMFQLKDRLRYIAVSSEGLLMNYQPLTKQEKVEIIEYRDNYIKLKINTFAKRLLVLTDMYYPSWRVYIDGKLSRIYRVDFTFRGVVAPAGEHIVEFRNWLL